MREVVTSHETKYFDLNISVTWQVYRNVKDEESSFGNGLEGM